MQPSNIVLLDAKEGALNFKLTDFGVSGLYNGRSEGELKELLPYSAPELLLGGSPDTGSDLYSLGVISYLILSRRLPFEDEDPGFLMQKHLQGSVDLQPVERLKGGKYLAQLLQVFLEKDAAKRLAPPEEVIGLIQSALKDDSSLVNSGNVFEGCFSAIRMIGREKEMERLQNCAERVKKSGRGRTVFISGEAGLGKTRCMEELKSWGNLEGWRVVEGSCSIQEDGSYGPYRQILAGAQPGRNEEVFNFGEALHNERSGAFESSMDYAAGQFRDFLTRELVQHLSKRPTLLLLEDFHEADEATSIVLDYLSSDIQAHPVLMCVSLRSEEEFGGALGRVIAGVIRRNRGDIVALEPLSQSSVEEFVSATTGAPKLSKTLGAWMFMHIGGNPFFLEEMLKHFVEQGLLWNRSGEWQFNPESPDKLEVPDSIGMVMKQRLGRLSDASRVLADWMALINRGISTKLLCSVSSLKPSEIVEALEELVHRQIAWVEIKNKEETAGLRHALIAEVIRSCLVKKKRQRMHRRIAEAFVEEYGVEEHLQELARHSMEGKLGEKAIRYALSLASRARMEFSHETTVRCFDFVLNDRSVLSKEERCRISIEASDALLALGLPKRAIRLLKEEIAGNRNIDVDLKGRMFMQLALSFQHLGDFVSQEMCCKKGLRLFRGSSNSGTNITKAMLYAELAFGAAIQSRPRRGLVFLEKALKSCPDSGATALLGRIQIFAATNYLSACRLSDALVAGQKAEKILALSNESYLSCSAHSTLGTILMSMGRFSQALEKHKQAVRISDKSRSVIPRAQALGNLAECLCRMGRTQEAMNALEEAMKLVGETENPAINHALNTILAEVRIAEGNYSSASTIIRKIGNKIGNNRASYAVGQAHFLSASLHFLLGNFDAAVASIDLLRRMETPEAPCYEHELAEALDARILFERGKKAEAVKRLRSLERTVAKKRWPYQMAIIKLHLGEILTKQGDLEEAARNIRNALRLANAMQSTPLISHGHFLMGSLYSREWQDGIQENQNDSLKSTVLQKPASLHRAIEELNASCRLSETSNYKEVVWRAHAELCTVYGLLQKEDERLQHAKAAYDCLCKLEYQTPGVMLPAFWNAFNRSGIKSELAHLIGSAPCADTGTDSVVSGGHDKDQTRILYRFSTAVNSIRDLDPLL
ncbi:MAG: AAA family ATPase, partial [Acidobacteriota bacterium]